MTDKLDRVEIRQMIDGEVFAVFDAIAKATGPGVKAAHVIDAVLRKVAMAEIHRANMVQRLTKGNVIEWKPDGDDLGDFSTGAPTIPRNPQGER